MTDLIFGDLGLYSDPTVDTLDVLTPTEAKAALNITIATLDAELGRYITAVSRKLDDLCGPIVLRTITAELYKRSEDRFDTYIQLRNAPASLTSATTITSATEYSSGTAQVLAAETLTASTSNDYDFHQRTGILHRRSGFCDVRFADVVSVTYSAGRYASTSVVDRKFKEAAGTFLQHLWRPEQGTGSVTFPGENVSGVPGFLVPNAVLDMLADEIQPKYGL